MDFRAGRQAGRAICFTLLKVLVGIPGNSAPGTTHLLPKKEKERERHTKKAGARQQGASPRHATPLSSRSCTAVSLPFLPVPVPVLCGRLLHRAPLVLPARPRADRTTLLLSRHQHTLCLVGEFTLPLGHMTESRPLLPSQRQRTSTRQNNKSCASRSTHVVVDMRSTVLW